MSFLVRSLLLLCLLYSEAKCNRLIGISDDEILRKTIFLYTAGQPQRVEKAIAFVLRNRYKANREEFGGRSVAAVCDQYWEDVGALPENLEMSEYEERKMGTWLPKLWNGKMYDFTKGALYFKLPDEDDDWTEGMEKTLEINKIKFYKD